MLFGVGITLLVSIIVGAFSAISEGGVTDYQERVFQDYADVEYAKAFGDSTAYEDNILIVFLTNEEADEYYYIAWVGDHIEPKVSDLFGNEHTELGRAMLSSVNTAGYWYSLDSNLAMMLDKMATCVESVDGIDDSFTCKEEHIQVDSKLVNYGELNLTESTVKVALDDFTERTGISIALVVDDMDEVFGVDYTSMIFRIVAAVIFIGTAIFLVVKVVKARKNEREGDEFYNNYKSQNDRW